MSDLKQQLWCEQCGTRQVFSIAPAWNEAACLECGERTALDGVTGATTEYLRLKAHAEWAKDVDELKHRHKSLGDVIFENMNDVKGGFNV